MTATLFPDLEQFTPATVKKPRPMQVRTIKAVRDAMRNGHKNVLVQAPCGSGKTLTGGWMIKGALEKGIPCLWMADRRELVTQPHEAFWELGIPNGVMMADRKERDYRCLIASKQSLYEWCIANGQPDRLPFYGNKRLMVFVDEAHISAQTTVWGIISEYMQSVEQLWVVGLTATPAYPDGSGMGDHYSIKIIGATYAEMRDAGYLCPLHLKAPDITDPDNQSAIVGNAYEHWLKWGNGQKTILFAKNIAQSKAHADHFCSMGVNFEHVDGTMPDDKRDDIIARLKDPNSGLVGITNCGVVDKGFDVPIVKCLILARRVTSPVLYRQMNRIQRPWNGQDAVFIDMAGTSFYHGFFPDDDIEWPFDPADTVKTVNAKSREQREREPIVCKKCFEVRRSGAVCPKCGSTASRRHTSEPLVQKQGDLFDVDRDSLQPMKQQVDKIKAWKGIVAAFANAKKPKKYTQALAAFKSRFGEWPGKDWPFTASYRDRHFFVSSLFPFLVSARNRARQMMNVESVNALGEIED